MKKSANEEYLLGLLRNKITQKEGVEVLIKTYQEPLYWHIRKLVINHDDSKDVLQEVFLRVWRNVDQFKGDSLLFTWLYRIAGNESIRFLEKKKRLLNGKSSINEILESELESSSFLSGDLIQIALQKAILKLPDKQRIVFNMRYFEELEYTDIAEILESTANSVKVLFHNAKTRIEEQLKLEI